MAVRGAVAVVMRLTIHDVDGEVVGDAVAGVEVAVVLADNAAVVEMPWQVVTVADVLASMAVLNLVVDPSDSSAASDDADGAAADLAATGVDHVAGAEGAVRGAAVVEVDRFARTAGNVAAAVVASCSD